MKNKRLIQSFGSIHDHYVKEAAPTMTTSTHSFKKIIASVACFAIIIALSLYLFIPFSNKGPDLTAFMDSEYFPIIERISAYRYRPSEYKNNFEYLTGEIGDFFSGFTKMDTDNDWVAGAAPEDAGVDMNNGSYVEVTDNQVNGVIESDIQKRTDKYIFRLSLDSLKVYSIAKDESEKVAQFELPTLADEYNSRSRDREMYLSEDGNTVTVITSYYSGTTYRSKVKITAIDVSNLENINVKKNISIDGLYKSSRVVDGKLLFISEFSAKSGEIDYGKPETYVPSITDGDKTECIKFENIIYPEELASTRYSVVALMDENTLELLGANALLDFVSDIYVSENNVYVTREYTKKIPVGENGAYVSMSASDIAVLNYAGEKLEYKGTLTAEGTVKDQYSMDEYEGHLRVVTSTNSSTSTRTEEEALLAKEIIGEKTRSASLSVFSLENMEKIAEVRSFAPQGEEAASVRFDGNTAYVCTAVIVTFTDPVYYFDLSDYANITYTDTGVIDGYSDSLIQLGDGFLLGIGRENWSNGKVEVYEERNGEVVSVDKWTFEGEYSTDYKSYYVNRDEDMFGLGIAYLYDEDTDRGYYNAYVLLTFNGYEIVEVTRVKMNFEYPDRVRAFIDDGYLYITDDKQIAVVSVTKE